MKKRTKMNKKIFLIFALGFLVGAALNAQALYEITTNKGVIEIKLDEEHAPDSSKNFAKYVEDKFYDGTIFHRVIAGFMIQGGGFTKDMKEKPTRPPINNEAKNKVKNKRGTLAMARTNEINSATSQFFINVVDNSFLDFESEKKFGYAVFAEVTKGMDVVDEIRSVKTNRINGMDDVPVETVLIESIRKKIDTKEKNKKAPAKKKKA
jgi:cyclophilin family peptidyl-prolyl cis-trans isomerase